jgi:hypothetical protein
MDNNTNAIENHSQLSKKINIFPPVSVKTAFIQTLMRALNEVNSEDSLDPAACPRDRISLCAQHPGFRGQAAGRPNIL